jgi:energy-converting hydrogenase A subunit R
VTRPLYVTDCEGPVSKNDNAFEIAGRFLSGGERLFALLSKFDDYLGDIENVPGYRTGSTLKYILPFLKSAGVTDRDVRDFSGRNVTIVPGVKETLAAIRGVADVFMVSTSYVHYIEAVCAHVGIPMDNAYCTRLSFDGYRMEDGERRTIMGYLDEFLKLPPLSWDEHGALDDVSRATVDTLKGFFDAGLPALPVHAWVDPVEPVGGEGKAVAVREIVAREKTGLDRVIYVGDSITDVEALALVAAGGGLAVSFNGNRYAVQSAGYIVTSQDASVLAAMVREFVAGGLDGVRLDGPGGDTRVYRKEDCDLENVVRLSEKVRKEVRGQAIGALG